MRWLGAHQLEHLYIRPAETWLRESLQREGAVRAGAILSPLFIHDLAAITGEDDEHIAEHTLPDMLSWRYHPALQRYYSAEIFVGPARRRAEQHILTKVKEQLAGLASWLWSNGSLYGSPEGRLSPDGTIGRVTAAMQRIVQAAPADTRIVPIYISYDFMTVGRSRIFVELAPAIEHAPTLKPQELNARLRQAWRQYARFSCTLLASGFLVQASRTAASSFTLDELAAYVGQQGHILTAAGRHVDRRLLQSATARKAVTRFLTYAACHGLVQRKGCDTWISTTACTGETKLNVRPGEVGYDRMPLVYAWNELQELLHAENGAHVAP